MAYKVRKILWVDTETTSDKEDGGEIHEISFIYEEDGLIVEENTFFARPDALDPENVASGKVQEIDPEALAVSGVTMEALADPDRLSQTELYKKLSAMLNRHVDKYNKKDKITMAGHRVHFDRLFMSTLWLRKGDVYFGGLVDFKSELLITSPMQLWESCTGNSVPRFDLSKIAATFGITFEAHTPMADIRVAREVYYRMLEDIEEAKFFAKAERPYYRM